MNVCFIVSCLSLLVVSACGGDDEGSESTGVNSGVDQSKPVNMLTAMELQQINESVGKSLAADAELVETICTFSGVFSTTLAATPGADGMFPAEVQMQCNQAIDQCKSSFQMNATAAGASAGVPTVPADTATFASCSVTVGELEACMTASVEFVKDVLSSAGYNCSAPPMVDMTQPMAQPTLPMECQALQTAECSAVISMPAAEG
jgi:hypothetical protein